MFIDYDIFIIGFSIVKDYLNIVFELYILDSYWNVIMVVGDKIIKMLW